MTGDRGPARRPDLQGVKILHIEDNAENRVLVRALLEAAGYTVVDAEDGLAGIEAAVREEPALILLDINLPGVDGYEVGLILRSFPNLSATPIVAVTAYAMDGDRQRTLAAGCDGYIQKPIDPDAFPRQVAEFLAGRRERLDDREASPYLRELNQRLVYRLVNQVEELKRLNRHFVRRAVQLEALHRAVQDTTAEVGVGALLRRLLPALSRALGTRSLGVELTSPRASVVAGDDGGPDAGAPVEASEVEWRLPLAVRGRPLGVMTVRHAVPTGAEAEEEQLFKIVANQVAIAVENARLYESTVQRAAEAESLVEAGRLLASTLELSRVLQRLAELVQRRLATDCVVRIWLRELGQPGAFCLHAQAGTTREPPPSRVRVLAGDGLIGGIVYRPEPVVVEDLRHDPRVRNRDRVREEGLVSFLGVPLLLEATPVGILTVATREPRAFTPEDVSLVEALARSAAVAIWNARLYEETQHRLSQTETLLAVSRALASTLDVTEVARRTVQELVRALGADRGGAWLLAPERDRLLPLAGYRLPRALLERPAGAEEGARVAAAIGGLTGPVHSGAGGDEAAPPAEHPLLEFLPHEASIVAPIRVKGETIGIVAVLWTERRRAFRREELRLVDGIVHQAAVAVDNARLLEAERQAREALQVSETRYRELFDNVLDVVWLQDFAGRLLEINESGVRASGYSRDELLGMSLADWLAPADRAPVQAVLEGLRLGRREVEGFTAEVVAKDGRRVLLECAARAVVKDGTPIAVLVSARDITLRRRLEQRQEALVALSRELAMEVDLDRLLSRIADETRRLMEMDAAVLWLLDGAELAVRGTAGVEPERVRRLDAASGLGRVARERQALVLEQLDRDPAWGATALATHLGYRALLAMPLAVKEQTLGVLTLLHREARAFPAEEIEFLRALSTHAALAIDNARLFAAQREEAEVSAGLLRLAQAIEGVQALDEVLDTVVRTTAQLMGLGQCALFLLDPSDGTLAPAAAVGVPPDRQDVYLRLRGPARIPEVVRAVETQEPVVADAEDPAFGIPASLAAALRIRSVLIVPLVSGGRLMGTMALHEPGIRHVFSTKEIALARGIAAHAAVAIDKARLFQQTQARLRETETLLTITRALSSTLDPTETMRRVAREIARTLGADMVGAYLADPEGEALHPIAGYRVPRHLYPRFMEFPIPIKGHRGLEEAWATRRSVWSADAGNDPRVDRASYERFPHQSVLFVPMTVKDEPIGGFFVVWWHDRRQFTAEEIRLVEGISDQAAMFIENARLYSEATRRRREAEELARLARMLTESLDAADVGERIVESALELLGGKCSVLRLLQPDGSLKLIASKGDPRAVATRVPVLPAGVGLSGRVVSQGVPAWSADVLAEPGLEPPDEVRRPMAELNLRAFLAAPLRVKRQIIGVIAIADEAGRAFSAAEAALLQTFADQAAIALENSRLYGDLRAALRAVEESQQRIVQGERLRALGEMAGGVAHDFNNVLAIIVGRAEVLLNETEDPELQRQLNVIIKVALDAAQTVRRIQEFTRLRRARPFQPVRLDQLVAEVVEVTRSRWKDEAQGKGVTYDVVVEAGPTPAVAGDPSEIREALTNILFNALDAMPDGGRVTLRTGVEGDRVVCAVSDTGVGMSEEVRQRIFDPFFTTKGERGTGLGLSVVYGILNRHNAEIEVHSAPGRGSTFVLRFPIARDPLPVPVRPADRRAGGRAGRILVVDDEKDVGEVLRELLTRDGHQVVICADGEEAVAALGTGRFELVITDLGMPGISGWEVARLVKRSDPAVPVAMVTGWGDRIDPAEAAARGVDFVLAKPFKRDQVREVVALALAGARDPAPSRAPAGP